MTSSAAADGVGLPEGWLWSTLGSIADYVNGRAFKEEDWESQGRPIIRIQNLTGSSKTLNRFSKPVDVKYLVEDGDVLLSWSATLGVFTYRGEEAILNQHIFNVRPTIHKRFVYHLLDFHVHHLERRTHGTGMKHITRERLLREPIMLPPDNEHCGIAKVLDTLDSTIAQTARLIGKLKAIKSGLLHDLLTRGIGEDGRVRNPEEDPEEFTDSPIGSVPAEWKWKPLSELTTKIGSGATPLGGKEVYIDEGVSLIRSQNVYDFEFVEDGLAHITDESARQLDSVVVEADDLLLNITGVSIGRACIVPDRVLPARVNQHVCIVRTTESLDSFFLLSYLCYPAGKTYLLSFDAGGTRNALTKMSVRIRSAISTIIGRIRSEEKYHTKLSLVKEGLMNDLLSGHARTKSLMEKGG